MKKKRRKRHKKIKPILIFDFLLVIVFLSLVIFAAKTLTDIKKKNQRKLSVQIDKEIQNSKVKQEQKVQEETADVKEEGPTQVTPPTNEEKTDATLLFGGDFYLDESWRYQYKTEGGISAIASQDILSQTQSASYSFVNLKGIYSDEYPEDTKSSAMKSKSLAILQELGIDMVNVANAGNAEFSLDEMGASVGFLRENAIAVKGFVNPGEETDLVEEVNIGGNRIGFLGITDLPIDKGKIFSEGQAGLLSFENEKNILSSIKKSDSLNELTIVYVSWGEEENSSITERQTTLAHKMVDEGADVIIGNHGQFLQGMEYYKGKPILYGLGRFMYGSKNYSSVLFKINLPREGEISYSLLPIKSAVSTTWMVDAPEEIYQTISQNSMGVTIDNSGNIIEEAS